MHRTRSALGRAPSSTTAWRGSESTPVHDWRCARGQQEQVTFTGATRFYEGRGLRFVKALAECFCALQRTACRDADERQASGTRLDSHATDVPLWLDSRIAYPLALQTRASVEL